MTDSTGKVIFRDTAVQTIVETGITYQGKTDVTEIQLGSSLDYIAYESNGDVSRLIGGSGSFSFPLTWFRLPTSGGGGASYTVRDTTISGTHQKEVVTSSYVGSENVVVAGKTFASRKTKTDDVATSTSGTTTFTLSSIQTFSVATELGMLVRFEVPAFRGFLGELQPSISQVLIAYTIK